MKFFLNIYEWLQKKVRPPSAFSWETLILLSLFSYYMAFLASTRFLEDLLLNFGWIFLILGVYWGTTAANQFRVGYNPKANKDGFPLSPWITGALLSVYLFGGNTGEIRREALIYWPTISAAIAALPDFLGQDKDGVLTLKRPLLHKRQNLIVLFGTQLLLSCWFQFNFLIQDWLVQYPVLRADDFKNSAFVVAKKPEPLDPPRGAEILNSMESQLRAQLNSKPWPQVERSLLPEERTKLINTIEKQTKQQLAPLGEDRLWRVTSAVSTRKSGYNLDLRALWQGPRAKLQENVITKSCQITQAFPRRGAATKPINTRQASSGTPISRFKCDPVKGWGIEQPTKANDTFIQ